MKTIKVQQDHTLYAFLLTLVALLATTILAALHDSIPAILPTIAAGSLGTGAGLAIPHRRDPS